MGRLVIGVMGHVDHGKTALVRALTGQDTDRLPEEKQRGISLALGFAHFEVGPGREIDLVDMPGHERFVRTMIAGATGIDASLLVVAANEGIKPQTVEHLDIATLLGLRRVVVAISKADLATPEQVHRVSEDVLTLLADRSLVPVPPVITSVFPERGMGDLRRALAALADCREKPLTGGIPFLPLDRTFTVTGHGPVVTGTLRGESIRAGETLELLPAGRRVRIRGLQVHGASVTAAVPGQRVAVNLRDVGAAALKRGMALAAPGALGPSHWLTVSLRSLVEAQPLNNGARLRALLGTAEVDCRLRLLDREVLAPGADGFAQLHLAAPVAIAAGEHVVLRLPSPPRTVAGGRILEPAGRRRKRHDPACLQRLREIATLSLPAMVAREVARCGSAGVALGSLSRLAAVSETGIAALLESLPVIVSRGGVAVDKAALDRLLDHMQSLLVPSATGLTREQLLTALPESSPAVVDEAVARLLAQGSVRRHAGHIALVRPVEEAAHRRREAALASRLATLLQRSGLTPPTPKQLLADRRMERAAGQLLRQGVIVSAVDRDKDRVILFHRDAVADARRRLGPPLRQGEGLLVSEIGRLLGISRKYSLPLLNYLDESRFTRRVGDRRVLFTATDAS